MAQYCNVRVTPLICTAFGTLLQLTAPPKRRALALGVLHAA